MSKNINNLISDFLQSLKQRGRSELTVRNYEFYLGRFLEFSHNPLLSEIDEEMILKYRKWLLNLGEESRLIPMQKNLKKSTRNYHLIALRSFLKYLRDKPSTGSGSDESIGTVEPEKIELEEISGRKIEFLGEAEMERILEAPLKSDAADIIKFRDKAILELLFSTGMRVSELVRLKKGDCGKDEIIIRGSKGRERRLTLSNQARHFLKKYLDMRTDKFLALFVGHDRAARARKVKKLVPESNLTARSIQRIVKKYAIMAGVEKKITPQVLRNSLAVRLLAGGEDEKQVQARLGHESITTTKGYQTV